MNKQEKLREDIAAFGYACDWDFSLQTVLNRWNTIYCKKEEMQYYRERADELIKHLQSSGLAIKTGRYLTKDRKQHHIEIESLIKEDE